MPTRIGIVSAALATILPASATAILAQTLPATAQTQPASLAVAQSSTSQSAQRATVTSVGGFITVSAENSSLNQILREIGRLTGMKITGGVNDERVYGTYGPTDPSSILSTLLRGTGSNMLLVFNDRQSPTELVLTPRNGGATPPNPNASRDGDREIDDLPPQRRPHFPQSQPSASGNPQQPFAPSQLPAQPAPGTPATQATPLADTTTQESPNGVKTPQQIYDQLMKLQQQQQKPAAGTITPH